ncbi:MAG: endonuclease MutS2 [Sphingobacteriaceae bacterium]
MIYPPNALEKLGFTEIKELLKKHCISPMGIAMVDKIAVLSQFDQIDKFLRQTQEFKNLLENDSPLPIKHVFDLKIIAEKVKIEGTFLTEEECFQAILSLQTVFALIAYFNERDNQYPNLEALFEHLPVDKNLLVNLTRVIDDKGKMKPNASKLLEELTTAIAKAEQEARRKLDQIYKHAQGNSWVADGSLTVREGRLCIPILAENKRKLKGYIHDESASGQTVYMEPEEVFHLNNQLRDLEFDKRREVIRILTELTNELRPSTALLLSYHGLLTKFDFVRAKALFAQELEANMPELLDEPSTYLLEAKHPLLSLNFKAIGQNVVPLNAQIDSKNRILVVSGPNAGGKSVCMKTIGLLQLMVQAGLLIPADPRSKIGVYRQIFADIGDDQSIESDLSTYSAHLTKMNYFARNATPSTLILIDEFGTGTDPQMGGPMAEAVLESLNHKQVKGVITTHYSNLKLFANATDGLENASMLFDTKLLKPLYLLEIGKPGSSYAFEIAQKIGLSPVILEAARKKVGHQQKRVDTLLVDLERDKTVLMKKQQTFQQQEQQLKKLLEENKALQTTLNEQKKQVLKVAKQEAQQIILGANKLVEQTIAQIKQSKADAEKTKALRQELKKASEATNTIKDSPKEVHAPAQVKSGDWVKLVESHTLAQVLEVGKDTLVLAMGALRTVVKKTQVYAVPAKELPKAKQKSSLSYLADQASFSPELDVRGKRGEEALNEIEKLLDKALVAGYPSLKIIHGKGDGILRKLIRDYFRKYSQVSRMEDEHQDRGGDGITYIYF